MGEKVETQSFSLVMDHSGVLIHFIHTRASLVNLVMLGGPEPRVPKEIKATRAIRVHEDNKVLVVLLVLKEKKERLEKKDDLVMMDGQATRVIR